MQRFQHFAVKMHSGKQNREGNGVECLIGKCVQDFFGHANRRWQEWGGVGLRYHGFKGATCPSLINPLISNIALKEFSFLIVTHYL